MSNHISVCKHKHLDVIPLDILTEQKFHKSALHPLNQFAFLIFFFVVVVRKGRFLKKQNLYVLPPRKVYLMMCLSLFLYF